jgi:hypothetical protein
LQIRFRDLTDGRHGLLDCRYMNTDVISVDQDSAGKQGSVFAQSAKCNMNAVGAAMDAWTGMTARQRRKRQEAEREPALNLSSGGTCTALPDCQQTWTRNLSNGDVALAFVNYTQVLASSSSSPSSGDIAQRRSGGGHVALAACDSSKKEQLWQLGATTSSGGMTTVRSMGGSKSCWEINGCGYRPGSGVDTGFGCKSVSQYYDELVY